MRTTTGCAQGGGLSEKPADAARRALDNSLYSVCLVDGDDVVGIGRVIGDGGCFFEVVDIVVLPAYQGKGHGRLIMDAIAQYLDEAVPKGAFVSLIAGEGVSRFYERYGFRVRPPSAPGMSYVKT